MKKWLHAFLVFAVVLNTLALPPFQGTVLASEREVVLNYSRAIGSTYYGTLTWWSYGQLSPPSYIKNITFKYESRFFPGISNLDSLTVQYQKDDGTWHDFRTYNTSFSGTLDLSAVRPVDVRFVITAGVPPLSVRDVPPGQLVYSDWYTTSKAIRWVAGDGPMTGTVYVEVSNGSETKTIQTSNPRDWTVRLDTSKNYTRVRLGCLADVTPCEAYVEDMQLADNSILVFHTNFGGLGYLNIQKMTIVEPVRQPGPAVLVSSPLSLTNWSTDYQSMTTSEYSAGQKIEQVAVQLSGFYGTYTLEGYDATLKSWVNIDPSGLTDYSTPRGPDEHTRMFWLDLRSRNITHLRLSANHASFYGVPSQISIPIIRTQYDGQNIYLTPVSPNNVVLQWSDGGNPQGMTYEIWRETLSGTGQVLKDERIGSTTALTFVTTDQEPGKRYRYRIRATDGSEFSAFTTPIEYYTPPVVTATPGERQINLSWTPVTGSDTYVVYLEEDGVWRNTGMVTSATGQFVIPNLSPNKRYRVRLEQNEPKHTGAPWGTLANNGSYVTPLWGPPGTPQISNISPNSITVFWDGTGFPSGTTFRLYRNGSKIYEGTLTIYTDNDIRPGEEYRYKVTALNIDNVEGIFSPEVTATVPELTAPSLRLLNTQASSPWNVVLSWDTSGYSSGVTYEVWRQTLSAVGDVLVEQKIGTTDGNTFETTDQTSGKFYRYRVRAVYGTDYLESNTVSYWTAPVPNVIAAEGALQLDWTPPAPGSAFNIYVNDGSGWSFVQTSSGSSATIQSLSPAKRYQVALEPANLPDGGYAWRATAEGTPLWHAPGMPVFHEIKATSVTVSWNTNGIPAGQVFQVYRNGVKVWEGTETSFTDTNLSPSTSYTYKVAAVNAVGVPGTFSPEATVTTAAQDTQPSDQPVTDVAIPANGKLTVEGAAMVDFNDGHTTYHQIPVVRSNLVTLRWNLDSQPEWVRYGTSPDILGQKQRFSPTYLFTLTSDSGLKTIYAELSTGELYYLVLLYDREPPWFSAAWLGNASVTRPGGQASLRIDVRDNFFDASDLQVSIDGGPWKPYSPVQDVALSGQGLRDVQIRVQDPAGNISLKTLPIFVLP